MRYPHMIVRVLTLSGLAVFLSIVAVLSGCQTIVVQPKDSCCESSKPCVFQCAPCILVDPCKHGLKTGCLPAELRKANVEALRKAFEEVRSYGGGTVVLPSGIIELQFQGVAIDWNALGRKADAIEIVVDTQVVGCGINHTHLKFYPRLPKQNHQYTCFVVHNNASTQWRGFTFEGPVIETYPYKIEGDCNSVRTDLRKKITKTICEKQVVVQTELRASPTRAITNAGSSSTFLSIPEGGGNMHVEDVKFTGHWYNSVYHAAPKAKTLHVNRCEFFGGYVAVSAYGDRHVITECYFHNMPLEHSEAIYVHPDANILVDACDFHNIELYAIQVWSGGLEATLTKKKRILENDKSTEEEKKKAREWIEETVRTCEEKLQTVRQCTFRNTTTNPMRQIGSVRTNHWGLTSIESCSFIGVNVLYIWGDAYVKDCRFHQCWNAVQKTGVPVWNSVEIYGAPVRPTMVVIEDCIFSDPHSSEPFIDVTIGAEETVGGYWTVKNCVFSDAQVCSEWGMTREWPLGVPMIAVTPKLERKDKEDSDWPRDDRGYVLAKKQLDVTAAYKLRIENCDFLQTGTEYHTGVLLGQVDTEIVGCQFAGLREWALHVTKLEKNDEVRMRECTIRNNAKDKDNNQGANKDAIRIGKDCRTDSVLIRDTTFGGAVRVDDDERHQSVRPRRDARSLESIASARSIEVEFDWDTYYVTGNEEIERITIKGATNSGKAFLGRIRLVAEQVGWKLIDKANANNGNILPKHGLQRKKDEVVILFYDPRGDGAWREE